MSLRLEGNTELQKALFKYPQAFLKNGRKTLTVNGNKLVRHAQKNHNFKTLSGQADSSIQYIVAKNRLNMIFFINEQLVKSGKFAYPVILHEGSYTGYKRSKSAPSYAPRVPKTGYGIEHDHFMDNAWNEIVPKINKAMVKTVEKTLKEVKLK